MFRKRENTITTKKIERNKYTTLTVPTTLYRKLEQQPNQRVIPGII